MFDEFSRPSKDLYFMNLCINVAIRSIDPRTKHGCVAVDEDGFVLSTGYNGPLIGSIDCNVPLDNNKYPFMIHAEQNCIFAATRFGTSLKNCTFYVSGKPCKGCMNSMIQVGAKRIMYGPIKYESCPKDNEFYNKCLENRNVRFEEFKDVDSLLKLNGMMLEYFRGKIDES